MAKLTKEEIQEQIEKVKKEREKLQGNSIQTNSAQAIGISAGTAAGAAIGASVGAGAATAAGLGTATIAGSTTLASAASAIGLGGLATVTAPVWAAPAGIAAGAAALGYAGYALIKWAGLGAKNDKRMANDRKEMEKEVLELQRQLEEMEAQEAQRKIQSAFCSLALCKHIIRADGIEDDKEIAKMLEHFDDGSMTQEEMCNVIKTYYDIDINAEGAQVENLCAELKTLLDSSEIQKLLSTLKGIIEVPQQAKEAGFASAIKSMIGKNKAKEKELELFSKIALLMA